MSVTVLQNLAASGNIYQVTESSSVQNFQLGTTGNLTNLPPILFPVSSNIANAVNGSIYAMINDSYGNIYIGGSFNSIGNVTFNNIAKWNTSTEQWEQLGYGLNNTVRALAFDSYGNLYIGGLFTQATSANKVPLLVNYICVYNQNGFQAIGTANGSNGLNAGVYTLAFDNYGNLYVGGFFTTTGTVGTAGAYNRIAIWNGVWNALTSTVNAAQGLNGDVYVIKVLPNNDIYVGGAFTTTGNGGTANAFNYVAIWRGYWVALTSSKGLNNIVYSIAYNSSTNTVYIGGKFTDVYQGSGNNYNAAIGYNPSTNAFIKLYNGLVLNSTSTGTATVRALEVYQGNLYATGYFTRASDVAALNIARFNLTTNVWENVQGTVSISSDIANPIGGTSFLISGNNLFIGAEPSTIAVNSFCAISSSYVTLVYNSKILTYVNDPDILYSVYANINSKGTKVGSVVSQTSIAN